MPITLMTGMTGTVPNDVLTFEIFFETSFQYVWFDTAANMTPWGRLWSHVGQEYGGVQEPDTD